MQASNLTHGLTLDATAVEPLTDDTNNSNAIILQGRRGNPACTPDRALPTLRDVAERAGVSPMTVSRAINRTARVSPRTQEAVQRAVIELGYVLNSSAQTLARRQTNRVVLILDGSIPKDHLGDLLLGAVEECSRRNLQLRTEQLSDTSSVVERVTNLAARGVIIAAKLPQSQRLSSSLAKNHIPVLSISPDSDAPDVQSISIDNRRAAFDMTTHLLDLGHSRIGFIAGPSHGLCFVQRLEGFREAIEQRLGTVETNLIAEGDLTYRSGLIAAEKLLNLSDAPSAIFACTDAMAAGALSSAHQHQISVPADLTICGFDDTPLAGSVWPTLTTIAHPIRLMIHEAIDLITCSTGPIEPGAVVQHRRVPHQLIRRQSDAIPRYQSLR